MNAKRSKKRRTILATLRRELGKKAADDILKTLSNLVKKRVQPVEIEAAIVEELSKHMLEVNRKILNPIVIDPIVIDD